MTEMNKSAENIEMFLQQGFAANNAGDYAKAAEWFKKAVAQGHAEAKDYLAKAEVAVKEKREAQEFTEKLRELAEQRNAEAAVKKKPTMEKIRPGNLVRLEDGEQYIIGAAEVTRYDEGDGKPHHFCLAIACGTPDLEGGIDEINKEDIEYTILEYWEEQNPNTGEPVVIMRENTTEDAIVEELFGLGDYAKNDS